MGSQKWVLNTFFKTELIQESVKERYPFCVKYRLRKPKFINSPRKVNYSFAFYISVISAIISSYTVEVNHKGVRIQIHVGIIVNYRYQIHTDDGRSFYMDDGPRIKPKQRYEEDFEGGIRGRSYNIESRR